MAEDNKNPQQPNNEDASKSLFDKLMSVTKKKSSDQKNADQDLQKVYKATKTFTLEEVRTLNSNFGADSFARNGKKKLDEVGRLTQWVVGKALQMKDVITDEIKKLSKDPEPFKTGNALIDGANLKARKFVGVGSDYSKDKKISDAAANVAYNVAMKIGAAVKKIVTVGLKSVTWMLTSAGKFMGKIFSTFIAVPIKMVASGIDSVMDKLFGKFWQTAKNLVSNYVIKPIKWFVNVGMAALSYVWSGMKVIFSLGVKVVKTAVEVAGYGIKKFTKFGFKTLMNTIMNPINWIVMIPVIGIFIDIFTSVAAGLIATGGLAVDIILQGMKFVSYIGGYVWEGIVTMFDGISTAIGIKEWGPKIIKTISWAFVTLMETIFGKENANTFISFVADVIGYIKDFSKNGFAKVKSAFDSVGEILKEIANTKGGITKWIIDKLKNSKISYLPDAIKTRFLQKLVQIVGAKYGTPHIDRLDTAIKGEKKAAVGDLVANLYVNLASKGMDPKAIQEKITSEAIPNLVKQFEGLSSSDFKEGDVDRMMKEGQDIVSGKRSLATEEVLKARSEQIIRLNTAKERLMTGEFDPSGKEAEMVVDLVTQDYHLKTMERIKSLKSDVLKSNIDGKVLTENSLSQLAKDTDKKIKEAGFSVTKLEEDSSTASKYIDSYLYIVAPAYDVVGAGLSAITGIDSGEDHDVFTQRVSSENYTRDRARLESDKLLGSNLQQTATNYSYAAEQVSTRSTEIFKIFETPEFNKYLSEKLWTPDQETMSGMYGTSDQLRKFFAAMANKASNLDQKSSISAKMLFYSILYKKDQFPDPAEIDKLLETYLKLNPDKSNEKIVNLFNENIGMFQSIVSDEIPKIQENLKSGKSPEYKLREGAVFDPNNNLLKLDAETSDYIKTKIEKITIDPENITRSKDNKKIVNRFQSKHVNMQSYELYTMKQLSVGTIS